MIKNLTKNKILAEKTVLCSSLWSKATGLMFSKKIVNKGLVFDFSKQKKRVKLSFHMFFVFQTIDLLLLDKKRNIVELKKDFKPFTYFSAKKFASFAIELPKGTIKRTKCDRGDKILFEYD